MKLAIPFKLYNEYNDIAKEFNINFDKNKNSLDKLFEFIEEFSDHRINISFPKGIDVSVAKTISKVGDNVYYRLKPQDALYVKELYDGNCKFFFDEHCPAYNYTTLDGYISLGVTDVYIADDLWYNLQEVSKLCKKNNVNIRLILNRIPSTSVDKGFNPRSPIFRPNDCDILNLYVDTCEFDCGDPYDWHVFNVLYRSWFLTKDWYGNLIEINKDLTIGFPNMSIVNDFTNYKLKCGYRCFTRSSNVCNKCEQLFALGEEFANKGIRFKKEKNAN